jgi:hypothetical protein
MTRVPDVEFSWSSFQYLFGPRATCTFSIGSVVSAASAVGRGPSLVQGRDRKSGFVRFSVTSRCQVAAQRRTKIYP